MDEETKANPLDEKVKNVTKKARDKLVAEAEKKTEKMKASKIQEAQVEVEKMASKQFEGWRIKVDRKSCGFVKFFPKVDDIFKSHVTVDFAVPQPKRGLHIGRIALKLAISKSIHSVFVAHLRKSNIASKKALAAVGFNETTYPGIKQLCMIFRKIKR